MTTFLRHIINGSLWKTSLPRRTTCLLCFTHRIVSSKYIFSPFVVFTRSLMVVTAADSQMQWNSSEPHLVATAPRSTVQYIPRMYFVPLILVNTDSLDLSSDSDSSTATDTSDAFSIRSVSRCVSRSGCSLSARIPNCTWYVLYLSNSLRLIL